MIFWKKNKWRFWENEALHEAFDFAVEIFKIIVISLVIIVPVRYFLIQPFYVKGASMEPNFYNHEYLIIDEISYRFEDPIRGETVIFRPPIAKDDFFIKRIIGLPGEKIEIKDGRVKIFNTQYPNGTYLDESVYLPLTTYTPGDVTYDLGPGQYFVMGDNRPASLDSRTFGLITRKDIVGRTWLRGWPFNRVMIFSAPQYNI
ncbi:MAG: signal peptidase I [Patescibacteria group bacterium]|jgi:signal peptidase I